jgi:hypothetical protein
LHRENTRHRIDERKVMTLSNRIRCFVEVAIMMLAVAAPSFAQISAHGYISDCDQTKALPDYGSARTFIQNSLYALHNQGTANDLKSTPRSSLAKYCIAELPLEKHAYQACANAYRESLGWESRLDQSLEPHPNREDLRHYQPTRTGRCAIPVSTSDRR